MQVTDSHHAPPTPTRALSSELCPDCLGPLTRSHVCKPGAGQR